MNQEPLIWKFNEMDSSGERSGNQDFEHILSNVSGDSSRTFVEEVINNSLGASDQNNTDPTEVKFTLRNLYGTAKANFLEALNWHGEEGLRAHLKAASTDSQSPGNRTLMPGLEHLMNEGNPLTILKIEDFNTTGLYGPEFENPMDKLTSPFQLLFKANYYTNEAHTDRPGSHGVGKAVLWRYSSISTVLGSSIYDDDSPGENRFRAIGKSQFPYHGLQDKGYTGKGLFGILDTDESTRIISVKDRELDEVNKLWLKRDPDEGKGTSLLIVGFREPDSGPEEPDSGLEVNLIKICDQFEEAIKDTFWPALYNDRLRVQITAINGDEEVFSRDFDQMASINPDSAQYPLLEMLAAQPEEMKDSLENPEDISMKMLEIKVPQRTTEDPPPHLRTDTTGNLYIRMAAEGDDNKFQNSVALIRGKDGFVVDYWSNSRLKARFAENPFHAIFTAGRFVDDTEESKILDNFLRASEPVTHDGWRTDQARLKDQYSRGYKKAIDNIYTDIENNIKATLGTPVTHQGEGPPELKRLFQMGGGGGGAPRQFTFNKPKASFDGSIWAFSRRIRKTEDNGRPWILNLRTVTDIDGMNKPEIIEINPEEFKIIASNEEDVITPDFLEDGTVIATIPAAETSITYEGKTKNPDNPDRLHLLRNSRMRIEDKAKEA
tara:strand:+ start:1853 stop:3838 length:1986 start_codon:yes stop_codon:yes gene_type:complete